MAKQILALGLVATAVACGDGRDETQVTFSQRPSPDAEEDAPREEELTQQAPPARSDREGPEGCYVPERFSCDCELTEAECNDAERMVWTTGCASCAE